ncbi:pentatricopeptide repeat-containing protein At3g29230-like [Selaginella moellendorffii]|uniref:pentatricopeptide repeat-containing protein At3g29230-like n=1 Tax=Selaginella moellendorffii TaxID=88036 RepID=UPI000D1CB080|nr:pentatricopeptide repeat-containing protein At3g29230-like [Selaginella moellendorffii]|eukprot:XP_024524821.1 pentatricopeptide repeat-containing protein At3g29230-like [Selaginella moellendorffii]
MAEERNLATWNSLLLGLVQADDRLHDARGIFDRMPRRDVVAYTTVMSGYARAGDLNEAGAVFDSMPERDTVAGTKLMAAYSQNGRVDSAEILFRTMPARDIVSWNTLIGGYGQNARADDARSVFDRMPARSSVSWNAMIAALAQVGRCGEARAVFGSMPGRDSLSWNGIISGYSSSSDGRRGAIDALRSMALDGSRPDRVTFLAVLGACTSSGSLGEALEIFGLIRDHGLDPAPEHFSCVVDTLGRSGRLRETQDLIEQMPDLPSQSQWASLLSSCTIHRDVKLGEIAARRVSENASEAGAARISLRNIYAVAATSLQSQ